MKFICRSGTKKEPKPKLLSPDIFWWGGGLPREGVGAKKFGMEAPEKFEKKNVWVQFSSPMSEVLHTEPHLSADLSFMYKPNGGSISGGAFPIATNWHHIPAAFDKYDGADLSSPEESPSTQEWPRQTKPKKGQFMNFPQGHSGTKAQCESCLFS